MYRGVWNSLNFSYAKTYEKLRHYKIEYELSVYKTIENVTGLYSVITFLFDYYILYLYMGLGDFFQRVEKFMISDIFLFQHNKWDIPHKTIMVKTNQIKVLNIFVADQQYVREVLPNIFNMCIGDNVDRFIQNINDYIVSLNHQHFNIINCRFSLKYFLTNIDTLMIFLRFVSDRLVENGIFMGFMLDTDKINGVFAEQSLLESGPYKLEMSREYGDELLFNTVYVNNEICFVISRTNFNTVCSRVGLKNVKYIDMKQLYKEYLHNIELSKNDKKFGFLNTVFIFKKSQLVEDE